MIFFVNAMGKRFKDQVENWFSSSYSVVYLVGMTIIAFYA